MKREATKMAGDRSVRRRELALPESLRLPATSPTLEAFGLRARALQTHDGALAVEIDGRTGVVEPTLRLAEGSCAIWPFATERIAATGRELLFAAPDQPVIALIREVGATETRAETDSPFTVDVVPLGESRRAILIHDPAFSPPDIESLIAAATARGRRRAANRPSVVLEGTGREALALAEHELRREMRRLATDAIAVSGSPLRQVGAVLAMYALNDRDTADDMLRAFAAATTNGAVAALLVGARAAWTGAAPDAAEVRDAALDWMRAAPEPGDTWAAAALALAPAAAEAMAASDVVAKLRATKVPAVWPALRRIAADEADTPAGHVLRLMHDELGIAPDAMRGRVGIRPARVVHRIDVEQVVVGDAVLSFHAETSADRAIWEVEQTSGGSPVTVLLEPRVPARRLISARVDETDAELDAAPEDSDLRVKVQLVADRPRSLELRYERWR